MGGGEERERASSEDNKEKQKKLREKVELIIEKIKTSQS